MEDGMAGAIARIDGIYPAPASHELPRPHVGVAERRRQAVQYAVSQDAPRLRVVSWADFRVAHIGDAFLSGLSSFPLFSPLRAYAIAVSCMCHVIH